ncbi:NADAR superfamily protein [Tetraselmis virus 1]|uniref:NADAR superfamily protein n=1 Tax=Tetraselmis virus 1 TaxID=2060617 RepID=A0A2P0VMW5_9VIRU|nr:NADAR superfamily protein [Tetraselmis virus 1]AUF82242.1 NADAR superfamily protein [Tetraselmis virus 1]
MSKSPQQSVSAQVDEFFISLSGSRNSPPEYISFEKAMSERITVNNKRKVELVEEQNGSNPSSSKSVEKHSKKPASKRSRTFKYNYDPYGVNTNYLTCINSDKQHKFFPLCNSAEYKIILRDIVFNTEEHALNYFKLLTAAEVSRGKPNRYEDLMIMARQIQTAKGSHQIAKSLAKGCKLYPDELAMWERKKEAYQYQVCAYKIMNYSSVANTLRATRGDYILFQGHELTQHSFWSGRVKNGRIEGKNIMGKIWMDIRNTMLV